MRYTVNKWGRLVWNAQRSGVCAPASVEAGMELVGKTHGCGGPSFSDLNWPLKKRKKVLSMDRKFSLNKS